METPIESGFPTPNRSEVNKDQDDGFAVPRRRRHQREQKQQNEVKNVYVAGQNSVILDEDHYMDGLTHIITRDFFPELYKIEEMRRGGSENSKKELNNVTLNEYLVKFNSEDNQSFGKLIKDAEEQWKKKHAWIFEAEERAKQQNLAIQDATGNKLQNMIEGNKNNMLAITDFTAMNNVMFPSQLAGQSESYSDRVSSAFKKVNLENTRITEDLYANYKKDGETIGDTSNYSIYTTLSSMGPTQLLGIKRPHPADDKITLDDVRHMASLKQRQTEGFADRPINGYSMISMPSPNPAVEKSPLMTWGELEATPMRMPEKRYSIPETSTRDQLGHHLSNKVVKSKKAEMLSNKKKQQLASILTPQMKRISSNLSQTSATNLLRNVLPSSGRRGTSSVRSTVSVKTPVIALEALKVTPTVTSKPRKGLPDNLLNI